MVEDIRNSAGTTIVNANRATPAMIDDALRLVERAERASHVLGAHYGKAAATGGRLAADVVRLGRPDQKLRARAFYDDASLSLVVHGRLRDPWPRRSALHRGADIRARIGSASGFRLPRELERGRGLRSAWLLEEWLPGRPIAPAEWPPLLEVALDGLAAMWRATGIEHVPVQRLLSAGAATTVARLLGDWPDPDIDPAALAERARELAARPGLVAVGWCHGDPVRPNYLLLPGGQLALLDWEAASRRAIAHDVAKMSAETGDPVAAVEALATRMAVVHVPEALDWRHQMALALLVKLARSRRRERRAEARSDAAFGTWVQRARRRNVRLLASLLLPKAGDGPSGPGAR